jgi:hypothetical protein
VTSPGPTRVYDHETDLDALVRDPDHVCHLGWAIVPTRLGRLLRRKPRSSTKTLCGIPWAEIPQHHGRRMTARDHTPADPTCHECGRLPSATPADAALHDRRIHDA